MINCLLLVETLVSNPSPLHINLNNDHYRTAYNYNKSNIHDFYISMQCFTFLYTTGKNIRVKSSNLCSIKEYSCISTIDSIIRSGCLNQWSIQEHCLWSFVEFPDFSSPQQHI